MKFLTVERSLNDAWTVVYIANVVSNTISSTSGKQNQEFRFHQDRPIDIYWYNGETDKKENLSFIDQRGYGITILSLSPKSCRIALNSCSTVEFEVQLHRDGSGASAYRRIAGIHCIITALYIDVRSKMNPIRPLNHLQITGVDKHDQEHCTKFHSDAIGRMTERVEY